MVLALVVPCSTAHFVFESYWPGPVTDYWMFLPGDVLGLGESYSALGMDGYYWILYSRPPQQGGSFVVWAVSDGYEACLVTHLQVNSAAH